MQKIADMTGVPLEKAHPHSLRHLFALTYIDTYNNIGELADILGHSSLEITRIYLSSSREEDTNTIILSCQYLDRGVTRIALREVCDSEYLEVLVNHVIDYVECSLMW